MDPDSIEEVKLHDGARIRIRRIRSEDKPALVSGFNRLSPESRYRRFFSPLDHLTEQDLRYLTEVDHHRHEAVIGFDAEDGAPVGVARYVGIDEPGLAEVAVTVIDDWQGRGVAKAMLENLTRRARAEGIERFVALVLSENEAALELFKALSVNDAEPRRSASGHLELLIELPDEAGISSSMLGRALRSAAAGEVEINPWRVLKHRLHLDRQGDAGGEADG